MNYAPELLLIGAVASVGVLHTIVPDHWAPITLIARQRGWSKAETARAAFQAGTGHVLSTPTNRVGGVVCRRCCRGAFWPPRRDSVEHRAHCFWRLDRDFGVARTANERRAWAQS
jgi:hypothetical protein